MSAPVSPRNSPKAATAPTDVDHRKRRRNRTTQSCLNCHATKRMCDRKRPCCTRCLQLGISGNCVYEVDDPNRQAGKQAEGSRLMNRITELEGVIRELKNKPQTRQERSPRADSPQSTPPNNSSWSSPTSTGYSSPGSQFPSAMTPSPPVPGYSRPSDSLASLIAAYAGLTDHMYVRRGGNCGCMTESACYNAVLELSLRLRKAADVLARSPSHSSHSDCPLNNHISDLDAFAKFVEPYLIPLLGAKITLRSTGTRCLTSPAMILP
ncbi:hypothetical protein C8R47DRAFT_1156019 [Mycena vitilis]|nr:hypothetical protein C8R47DRAFT_1156019 [Mycena vitilis]